MAATTGIYSTTPQAGVNLYDASSAAKLAVLNVVAATDGRKHVYAKAAKALSSIQTIQIGDAGSASTLGSTTATYIVNTPGGIAASQYFWARQRSI